MRLPEPPTDRPEDFRRPPPSPASLLPPRSKYRRGLTDRFGDDGSIAPTAIYAFFTLTPMMCILGFLMAYQRGLGPLATIGVTFGFGLTAGLVILFGSMAFARGTGKSVGSFVVPSGSTTPYQRQFSSYEALVAGGRIDEAIMAFESELTVHPEDIELIVRAANVYLDHKREPSRAAELLRRLRALPQTPPEKVLYASHRLVDLYLGPLNDRGRAIVELRVIIDRFPGSQAATFARDGLAKLKKEHHESA